MKRIINIIVVLLLFGVWATSCKTAAREEKYYERQEKKLAAEEQKAYDNRVKEHQNIQSKETQKMMRATERNSKQLNKSRRR
jgi:sortase (surface protein transpeptidase)